MRCRIALAASAVTLITCAVGFAHAAEPDADELIARGLELRRDSKPEQALELFQRAHALAPSPRTLGQIGLVEASLEHWLDAETHLTGSLATPDDAWVRKNRAFLDQALRLSQDHLGELVITGPAGTTVAVDGKSIGALPDVPPVRHVEGNAGVTANGPGFKEFSKTVTIAARAEVSLAIVLDPAEPRPAVAIAAPVPRPASVPPLAPEERRRPAWKTWTGTGLVAAGAGLLTWGIVWIAVDGNDRCPIGGPSCVTVYDTKTTGWILAAGGAAAAAGGAVLLLTGRHGENPNVALAATPTSLFLRGQF
jgi:hypothetical protein